MYTTNIMMVEVGMAVQRVYKQGEQARDNNVQLVQFSCYQHRYEWVEGSMVLCPMN